MNSEPAKPKLGRATTVDLRILKLIGRLGAGFGLLRAGLEGIGAPGGSVEEKLAYLAKALKEYDDSFFKDLNELVDQLLAEAEANSADPS